MRAPVSTNNLGKIKMCDGARMNKIEVWIRLNFLDITIFVAMLILPAVIAEQSCQLHIFLMRAECFADNV